MMRDSKGWLLVVLMCLGFMAAACSSNNAVVSPEAAAGNQDVEYRLGVGDQLRITVFGHEDMSAESIEVDSAGRITLPLAGDLVVINRTLEEVKRMIVEALTPEYLKNPQVSVEVLEHSDFYILGEVANPGPYPYTGGTRVINAVAMAGGFTYRAVEDEFVISRNGQQFRARQETPIRPGDVIKVRERFF
jgi:polysaccharide export outer membrane protein